MQCPNCGAYFDGQRCLMCGYAALPLQPTYFPPSQPAQQIVVAPGHKGMGAGGIILVLIVMLVLAFVFLYYAPQIFFSGVLKACGLFVPFLFVTGLLTWRRFRNGLSRGLQPSNLETGR